MRDLLGRGHGLGDELGLVGGAASHHVLHGVLLHVLQSSKAARVHDQRDVIRLSGRAIADEERQIGTKQSCSGTVLA